MDTILLYLGSHWLELITLVVSLVWLYLEYKASIWLWPVGIVLPLLWIPICWHNHLYGMLAINVYYLVTSIIGWAAWLRKPQGESEDVPITNIPLRWLGLSIAAVLIGYTLLLHYHTLIPEWGTPWADAMMTMTAIVGMLWMARKWRQHWCCWVISNAFGLIALYRAGDMLSSVVYLVNFIVAICGYVKWGQLMKQQAN